ncbi:MAG: type II secretion system GspH family protein [Gammaproteobacteria bacterium]|nr:type II secretion system GspH family protein [Gammaproteobacteria bacterium]MDH5515809.1 type II secretion system GspH family protein [Gammaproteobacteria bacterium]
MHQTTTLRSVHGNRTRGFTLVEVVIVLVALGILASIAIPRFVNLKGDAQLAVLKGVRGALNSTTEIYQPLAAIRGVYTGNLNVNGTNVRFHSGYPEGNWNQTFRHILDISTKSSFTNANALCTQYRLCGVGMQASIPTVSGTTGGRGVIIWPEGFRISEQCFAYYYNRHDGSYPMIGVVDTGCQA